MFPPICAGWTEHVRAAGFPVEVVETNELNRVKVRLGVPAHLAACHTGEVDGYVIEGHLPAATIKRLLAERPAVKGLAVRGMPIGSPGMEVEGAEPETYDVIAFGPSGETRYARYKGAEPVSHDGGACSAAAAALFWSMAVAGIFLVAVLLLAVAALAKYVFVG